MLHNELDKSTDETLAIGETVLPIEMILHTFNLADTATDAVNNAQSCRFFNRLVRATSPFIKKDVKDFPNYACQSESTIRQLKTSNGALTVLSDSFKHCFVLNAEKVFTVFFVGSGYLMGIIKIQPHATQQMDYTFEISQCRPKDWVVTPIKINHQSIAYPCPDASVCVCEWNDDMSVTYHYLGKDKHADTMKDQDKNSDGIARDGRLALRKSDGMLIHLYWHPKSKYTVDFYDVNNGYKHVNTTYLSPQLPPSLNVSELVISKNGDLIFHDQNTIYITNKTGEELLQTIATHSKFTQLHSLANNKVALLTLSGVDIWCLTTQTCVGHIDREYNDKGLYQLKVLATGELLLLDTPAKGRKLAVFNAVSGDLIQDLTPTEMDIANAVIMPSGEIISILDNNDVEGNIYLQIHRFNKQPELQEEQTPTRLSY